jgi:uncharacterized membrane protein (UPF0127 family)
MPTSASARTVLVRKTAATNPARYVMYGILVLAIAAIAAAVIFTGDESSQTKRSQPKNTAASACGPYRKDLNVKISGETIETELAKTAAEFQKGLAGRPCILPSQGMLFAYTKPGQYKFWMKGMKFPIDIIWIGANRQVVGFYNKIQPSTYPDQFTNEASRPAQYVLELKAGRAEQLHITLGTPVTL